MVIVVRCQDASVSKQRLMMPTSPRLQVSYREALIAVKDIIFIPTDSSVSSTPARRYEHFEGCLALRPIPTHDLSFGAVKPNFTPATVRLSPIELFKSDGNRLTCCCGGYPPPYCGPGGAL